MSMFKATIFVTLRPSILDPKGKASLHALQSLGMSAVQGVRMGKLIEMDIHATTEEDARAIAVESCEKLLANVVMENYHIDIKKA
jgi:phosphoribosylformylglycinamidine synthase subunit PurS